MITLISYSTATKTLRTFSTSEAFVGRWKRSFDVDTHTHTLLSGSCACAYLVDFSAQPKRLSKVSFQDQNRAWTHAYKDPSYFVSVANILHLPFKTNENKFSASTISSYTSVLCREFLLTSDLRNFSNFMWHHPKIIKFFTENHKKGESCHSQISRFTQMMRSEITITLDSRIFCSWPITTHNHQICKFLQLATLISLFASATTAATPSPSKKAVARVCTYEAVTDGKGGFYCFDGRSRCYCCYTPIASEGSAFGEEESLKLWSPM